MKNILRLYLSGPVSKGVVESQMISWSQLLEEKGIHTVYFVFYKDQTSKKFAEMDIANLHGDFRCKKYLDLFLIREFSIFIYILRFLNEIKKKEDVSYVIQTRSSVFTLAIILLELFYNFKMIYEIRGAGEEGSVRRGLGYFLNCINDRLMLIRSQKVITVSQKLLEHKIEKYNLTGIGNKSVIIHGAADSKYFFYNPELRQGKRSELNIVGSKTLLYVGMLDKPWQIPDYLFHFVSLLMKRISNLFFIVITPNLNIAIKSREKYGIDENKVLIQVSPHEKLNEFINASDYGLLLRENTLVNNVASPTKFAEYLLGGLPVIISDGVGDYTEFTEKNEVGIVVNIAKPNIHSIVEQVFANGQYNRNRIEEIGHRYFSKQSFLSILNNTIISS